MLDQIVQELEREGYFYLEDLLKREELSLINKYFENHKNDFHPAKVGSSGQKMRMETIRGDFTLWLDPLNPPLPFERVISFLNTLKEEINADLYLGLKEYECHLAYYPEGSFYKKHLDRFEADSSRRISFIFYLNEQWDKKDGGELVMYDNKDEILKAFSPLPGSFICFLSDEFPHEVKPSIKERRSLTGWMHNKLLY